MARPLDRALVASLPEPVVSAHSGDGPSRERGGEFAGKPTATLAAQCRMQARDNLDPEYSRFMFAVADRLHGSAAPTPDAWGVGYLAALHMVQAMACEWRDENRAAAAEAGRHGDRSMRDRLDGAATECHAFSGEIEKLAQAMSAGTAETLQAAQGDSPPARSEGCAQSSPPLPPTQSKEPNP
jgi:hypothetical protein